MRSTANRSCDHKNLVRTPDFKDRLAAASAAKKAQIERARATASAYLLVLISKDGNHRSLPPGRYACELIKEDSGQWRFSRRTVFHDHDYTLDGIGR